MSTSLLTTNLDARTSSANRDARDQQIALTLDQLRQLFGVGMSLWDASGELLGEAPRPFVRDPLLVAAMVRPVAQRQEPQLLEEAGGVVLLGVPLQVYRDEQWVAVGPFVTSRSRRPSEIAAASQLLNLDEQATRQWRDEQPIWDPAALMQLAQAARRMLHAERKTRLLHDELQQVTHNLTTTYEEISLLYGIIQHLRLSSSDCELGQLTIDWLMECLPAEAMLIQYLPVAEEGTTCYEARTQSVLLRSGQCDLTDEQFNELVGWIQQQTDRWPLVANRPMTRQPEWPCGSVRQLILAPLCEGQKTLGWLAAVNHRDDDEFDSTHAGLIHSVAGVLGIHSGNLELYRQQSELVANIVRSLTSAIDAKDPYTCGHSDRVARIAVRLAKQLGCDSETLNTLYMAGLLHDIGKIGIDDNVLRKAGRLSEAEYEHIKLHPILGCKILADLKPFAPLLPVVRHHHEQWDGRGYPDGLAGDQIPYLARICAVADAYDAMTSDRPYRKGMPEEKVDEIFRQGAGVYWDPRVVEALFEAKEEIRQIASRQREHLMFDVQQWA